MIHLICLNDSNDLTNCVSSFQNRNQLIHHIELQKLSPDEHIIIEGTIINFAIERKIIYVATLQE